MNRISIALAILPVGLFLMLAGCRHSSDTGITIQHGSTRWVMANESISLVYKSSTGTFDLI
ncbi:MAG: hypothetical protein R6V75_02335, partial [Bacteroidales bacterium]